MADSLVSHLSTTTSPANSGKFNNNLPKAAIALNGRRRNLIGPPLPFDQLVSPAWTHRTGGKAVRANDCTLRRAPTCARASVSPFETLWLVPITRLAMNNRALLSSNPLGRSASSTASGGEAPPMAAAQ